MAFYNQLPSQRQIGADKTYGESTDIRATSYNLYPTTNHVHNGADAPRIAGKDLDGVVTSLLPGAGISLNPKEGQGDVTVTNSMIFKITRNTIADNTNVTVSQGTAWPTDTVVAHGLGFTPNLVVLSCKVAAGGSTAFGLGTGTVAYMSYPYIAYGHCVNITQTSTNTAPLTMDMNSGSSIGATGTGGGLMDTYNSISVSIISVDATNFTFRISGLQVGNNAVTPNMVTSIYWTAM